MPKLSEVVGATPKKTMKLSEVAGDKKRLPASYVKMLGEKTPKGSMMLAEEPPLYRRMMPSVGQFVGGLVGFGAGARRGKPYRGSAIGGIAGRGLGVLLGEQMSYAQEHPVKAGLELGPGVGLFRAYQRMTPGEQELFKSHMKTTAATEAVTAGGAYGVSRIGKVIGRGATRGLLGERIAKRGEDRGWKELLKPEHFKERVPKKIAMKMNTFFDKLSDTTGKGVKAKIYSPKYKDKIISLADIKDNVRKILPRGMALDDLNISDSEKRLLANQTQKILDIGDPKLEWLTIKQWLRATNEERNIKLPKLWRIRKELDSFITYKSWSDDAYQYLNKLRNLLNKPIRKAGSDIAKAFDRYAFVKQSEYDLGRKIMGTVGPGRPVFGAGARGKEIYSPKLESFVKNLLSTDKDELIRQLKALDSLNKADDKVIEQLLDYAAAEGLDKGIGFGPVSKMIMGLLGGRKRIAQVAGWMQRPAVSVGGKDIPLLPFRGLVGRGAVTKATDFLTE